MSISNSSDFENQILPFSKRFLALLLKKQSLISNGLVLVFALGAAIVATFQIFWLSLIFAILASCTAILNFILHQTSFIETTERATDIIQHLNEGNHSETITETSGFLEIRKLLSSISLLQEKLRNDENDQRKLSQIMEQELEAINKMVMKGQAIAETIETGFLRLPLSIDKSREKLHTLQAVLPEFSKFQKMVSKELFQTVLLVDSMEKQTRVLAINANLEATKVGEKGKGFEVVAESLHKMSEQVAKVVAEVKLIISLFDENSKEHFENLKQSLNFIREEFLKTKESTNSLNLDISDIVAKMDEMKQAIVNLNIMKKS